MRSAFFGLHVATSGLHTARANLNVTSHNIANAEIPGFSRQVAQMQAGRPLMGTGRGMYGTGSQVTGVIQIRDRFLDKKFWHQNAISGQHTAVNQHLNFVETVFNQLPNVGVKRTFNGFFSTLQDLTTRAHEPTFRTNVATNAHTLAEQVRQNAFALQRQQQDLNREFADVVVTINSLGQQISDLNNQIHIFERDGSNANDLRDQRALLIDQLSNLVNVQVDERDFSRPGMSNDRRLTVMINGYDFIDHTRFSRLELVPRDHPTDPRSGVRRNEMDVHGLYEVFFAATGSRFNIHSQTLTGKLRGIVDVRDGNGGQITASPLLTGQQLIQTQLDALNRTTGFLLTLDDLLDSAAAGLTAHIAARDAALANINTLLGTGTTINSTASANSRLVALRTQRDSAMATLPSLRNAFANHIGFTALRTSIAATVPTSVFNTLNAPATTAPPTPGGILTQIQTHINTLPNVVTPEELDTFADELDTLLDTLATQLAGQPDLLTAIADMQGRIADTAPGSARYSFNTVLENIEDLNEQLSDLSDYISDLNAAIAGINQVTSFTSRVELQLEWAIGNTQQMIQTITERLLAIELGREFGEPEEYEALLAALEAQIEAMRDARDDINFPDSISVYSTAAEFQVFLDALADSIPAVSVAFPASIAAINTAVTALSAEWQLGSSRILGTTSNFKGIPFYMNQLNHLIRTFARAMNEGRNADGSDIPDSIGHIFGFDANGENRNALFFTLEDEFGQSGLVDHDDPFRSLRMWILTDGTTVQDPNPPANVARDSMGRPLFTIDYSQFNALNFKLNPELLEDPSLMAASSNPNVGQANNDVIHGFLAVGNDNSLFREGRLIDFIIATSNHLAVDNNQASMFRESYYEITKQTHNHRLSIKSVDTEEEMMNLVRFQNMFIATSRLVNVIDTIYDTLINRLGNF
ncbi:MAG: flagellar hook-associated protein FlgK [Defluviitaleaceae bacterium]|nr:flagellar hook-associated protein FlgK [Defluviitaleaceae bacterium]